jgi:hypothetical protein
LECSNPNRAARRARRGQGSGELDQIAETNGHLATSSKSRPDVNDPDHQQGDSRSRRDSRSGSITVRVKGGGPSTSAVLTRVSLLTTAHRTARTGSARVEDVGILLSAREGSSPSRRAHRGKVLDGALFNRCPRFFFAESGSDAAPQAPTRSEPSSGPREALITQRLIRHEDPAPRLATSRLTISARGPRSLSSAPAMQLDLFTCEHRSAVWSQRHRAR